LDYESSFVMPEVASGGDSSVLQVHLSSEKFVDRFHDH